VSTCLTSSWAGWAGWCKRCGLWQRGENARRVPQPRKRGAHSWLCLRCGEEWAVGVWPWACPAHAEELEELVGRVVSVVDWDGPAPCEQRGWDGCTDVPAWLEASA
jgi:hypothetical protein